eukprot:5758611-Alexandrium_andersonii.AAC.1
MPQAEEVPPPTDEPELSGGVGGGGEPAPAAPVGKSTTGGTAAEVKSPPPPSTPRSGTKPGATTSSLGPACDAVKAAEAFRKFAERERGQHRGEVGRHVGGGGGAEGHRADEGQGGAVVDPHSRGAAPVAAGDPPGPCGCRDLLPGDRQHHQL